MSDERAFLKAIRANPDDRTARLVYADWLQERDDPRGELIRIEEELSGLPIHSDRYWELKPRRRELLGSAERPWLKKMGYGGTDYQPVFADVPSGWKERWRLLREFVERWYQIPIDDVCGQLKPFPVGNPQWRYRKESFQSVDSVFQNRELITNLPPSLREWMLFIRELRLRFESLGLGNGDTDLLAESPERVDFFQDEGHRECYLIRAEDRHHPDPQVWRSDYGRTPVLASPHLTTFALQVILMQYAPEFSERPEPVLMSKQFARRLANTFPVRSSFDGLQVFERPNAVALWMPRPYFTRTDPHIKVWWRSERDHEEVWRELSG